MQKYKSNLTTASGSAVRGANITVLDSTGALASIYLDKNGTVPSANPVTTGNDGTFSFYAANGRYSLRTDSAGANVLEEDVILLNDPVERYASLATDAELRDRATHTGTQAISTVAGLQDAIDAKDTATQVHTAAAKATPVDSDELGIIDSAAGFSLKKLTFAALKTWLKGQFREKLTAPRTYYVRTDGSDANTGLSNTAGGAFATIQKAIDTASALDNGGYDVTITVGAGTFTGTNVFKSFVGGGKIVISGAGAGSTVVQVSTAGTACFSLPNGATPLVGQYDIVNMTLQATAVDCFGIDLGYGQGGVVTFGGIEFGSFSSGTHLRAGHGALLSSASRAYSISGASNIHIYCTDGGQVRVQNATVTLSGTVTLGIFVVAERHGNVLCNANTYSGTASGTKYQVGALSYALGVSTFPGSTAGTADATSVAVG